jgi:hypothetical protein
MAQKFSNLFRNSRVVWERFWFCSESLLPVRTFRLVFGLLLFSYFLSRTPDLEIFYSDRGILPRAAIPEMMGPLNGVYSLLNFFTSTTMLWVFHSGLLLSLLSMAFGFLPRFSAFIASILHISFMHRNFTVSYGVDAIATYFLVYLSLADGSPRKTHLGSFLSSIAFRFCQIQVCIIYAYSGWMKLAGPKWWRGEAVWDVLINHQLARWDFSWVASFPVIITLLTYATIAWEVYFPILVWIKPLKRLTLLGGVLLHLGIGVALNIPYFAAVMISTYILFLDEVDIQQGYRNLLGLVRQKLKVFS